MTTPYRKARNSGRPGRYTSAGFVEAPPKKEEYQPSMLDVFVGLIIVAGILALGIFVAVILTGG